MMAGRHAFENRIDRRKSREKTLLLSLKIDPKTKTREGVSIAGISKFNQSSNPFYGTICVKLFQELTFFQKAKSTINEHILNIYKEGELEKAVAQAAPTLREMAETLIKENFAKYSAGTEGVAAYLDRIATSNDLSDHEQSQKEVLITGLALLRKMEDDRTRAPLQSLLDGQFPSDSPIVPSGPQ